MPTFTNSSTSITETDISQLEQYAGISFPTAYRAHLLQYNGGECYPADFDYMENGIPAEGMVEAFLPIADTKEPNLKAFITAYKITQQRLPARMLPIAYDPGDNLICISCSGQDAGAIYLWDQERETDDATAAGSEQGNMYLIQPSLEDFLGSLKEEGDDDWSFMQ